MMHVRLDLRLGQGHSVHAMFAQALLKGKSLERSEIHSSVAQAKHGRLWTVVFSPRARKCTEEVLVLVFEEGPIR